LGTLSGSMGRPWGPFGRLGRRLGVPWGGSALFPVWSDSHVPWFRGMHWANKSPSLHSPAPGQAAPLDLGPSSGFSWSHVWKDMAPGVGQTRTVSQGETWADGPPTTLKGYWRGTDSPGLLPGHGSRLCYGPELLHASVVPLVWQFLPPGSPRRVGGKGKDVALRCHQRGETFLKVSISRQDTFSKVSVN